MKRLKQEFIVFSFILLLGIILKNNKFVNAEERDITQDTEFFTGTRSASEVDQNSENVIELNMKLEKALEEYYNNLGLDREISEPTLIRTDDYVV